MRKETKNLDMGVFYKVTDEQLLKDRNELFKEAGIPKLVKNGFVISPFEGSWHGEFNKSIQGYIYEFSRLKSDNNLKRIDVYIIKGEKWIQIHLNIFKLSPKLKSIFELSNYNGVKFGIPPNSITKMRLRNDDYKGPPFFYMLFLPSYKIGEYYTKSGYNDAIKKLKNLINSDLENIDNFVKRWHELHKPPSTDWEGNIISNS